MSSLPRSPRASASVADVGTPASRRDFWRVEMRQPCMYARAPLAGHRTACCSSVSYAFPLVSHTRQVVVGPHCRCPSAGAPVTRGIVTSVAPAETFLAWDMSECKTETLPWPKCLRSCVRTCMGDDARRLRKCRQRRRIPATTWFTPRGPLGDKGLGGNASVSTVGCSSLATVRGSPGSVMTSPLGASRNAVSLKYNSYK